MNLDRYRSFVKDVLTPQRFQHSLGVMQVMRELSSVYALDQTTALIIGLLHDAAKDMEPARQLELAKEANIPTSYRLSILLLTSHGFFHRGLGKTVQNIEGPKLCENMTETKKIMLKNVPIIQIF